MILDPLQKSQVDAEMADMITMTAEEAASAAARAIAEAEALMAEAEAATREAEAAEADAQAAQAFAEAERNRNITELVIAPSLIISIYMSNGASLRCWTMFYNFSVTDWLYLFRKNTKLSNFS